MESRKGRKRLPVRPSIEHLRKQAKRLARADAALSLSEAQHRLATEYGFKHWAELTHVVEVMNRGADRLAGGGREYEALPKASRARDVAEVRRILGGGEYTPHDLDAALAHAAWYGGSEPEVLRVRREIFDLLLAHGADPDGQYGSAYGPIVFGTGECQSVEGLEWLLEAGCDVTFPPVETKYGGTCVLTTWTNAYARGDNDARRRGITLLLERGAHVPPELTPDVLAVLRGDAEGLRGMLRADPELARRRHPRLAHGNLLLTGATLLHVAIEYGERACAEGLLEAGADVNARADVVSGFGGQTPVFHALGSMLGKTYPLLEWFVREHGRRIDWGARCEGLRFSDGEVMRERLTPLGAALAARGVGWPEWRRGDPREPDLLRSAGAGE